MRPENEARLAKIKKLSWFLRVPCVLFMVFQVFALDRFVTGPIFGPILPHGPTWGEAILFYPLYGVKFTAHNLTVHDRVLVLVLYTLTSTIAFLCGLQLFRLLGFYSRGEIFTSQSVGQIRLWAFVYVAWGLVKVSWIFVPRVVSNSRRYQDLDLTTVLVGLIIVAISWFMAMAAEMREENELTV